MVILGVTLVPLLHGSGVYTAYEYLEQRPRRQTRSFTAFYSAVAGDERRNHHGGS